MGTKYYTSFILNASCDECSEFSGVVEVERQKQAPYSLSEVEEMLAFNFEVDADDVTVLHWSRLH